MVPSQDADRPPSPGPATLPLRVGGRPALDFLNTLEARGEEAVREFVPDLDVLLVWVESLDLPLPTPVTELRRIAAADPDAAGRAYARAIALRESLYQVFAAALERRPVGEHELALVNEHLCQATDHHVLRPAEVGGVRDGWLGDDSLESPLWLIIIDAWDLLTTDLLRRVHECPGDQCGWLFLDTSRSGTRRWCDMRTCGNRAKVRSHYSRNS
jgi:predicted RNA-binding Zn ribbon-like protein